jgi:uncharacterized protein (DUF697 family)
MEEEPEAENPIDGEEPLTGELVDVETLPLSLDEKSDKVVRDHVKWAMGAGLVPIPFADLAGVTAIQMNALKKLAALHGVDYTEATGKRFVTALAGGVAARMGASMIKALPGVGSVIGGLSMAALSGASTYAICQVADDHFRAHGDFLEFDWDHAKAAYQKALDKGKEMVKSLEKEVPAEADVVEAEAAEAADDNGPAEKP